MEHCKGQNASLKNHNELHVYESGMRDVYLFHINLVVVGMMVKFSEKIGSMKFIQEVINN